MHRTRKLVSNLDLEIIFEMIRELFIVRFFILSPPSNFPYLFFYLFCVVRSLLRIIIIFHFFLFFISVS